MRLRPLSREGTLLYDPDASLSVIKATNANWQIPANAKLLEIICVGGGGGGGGGGSSSAIAAQVGGGGGGAGLITKQIVDVGSNTTLAVTVGAGGAGGAGGASGGAAGTGGSKGGDSSVTGTGVNVTTKCDGRGVGGGANSATTVGCILWGNNSAQASGSSNPQALGTGGTSTSTGANAGSPPFDWVGGAGGGGGPTSATLGGGGGGAGSLTAAGAAGGTATSGTSAGVAGAAAGANTGAGGGGGGGGAWNGGGGAQGAGGAGGAGGSGFVIIRVVG